MAKISDLRRALKDGVFKYAPEGRAIVVPEDVLESLTEIVERAEQYVSGGTRIQSYDLDRLIIALDKFDMAGRSGSYKAGQGK